MRADHRSRDSNRAAAGIGARSSDCSARGDRRRPRLLLLAYACHPEKGSEPGVGWQRAVRTAEHFDTWVLCEGRRFTRAIEDAMGGQRRGRGLEFVPLATTDSEELLGRIPGVGYLLSYHFWHRRARRVAQELHDRLHFDLIHQVTICSYREPGFLWQLDAPFVWGPLGGTQSYPWRLLAAAGLRGAISEGVRNVLNGLQLRYGRRIRRALRAADIVLAANSTVQRDLARFYGVEPVLLLETGIDEELVSGSGIGRDHGGPLRILWNGHFKHHKALPLLLDALGGLPASVKYELRILGAGPLARSWRRRAHSAGVAPHTQWLGWVPRRTALEQARWADVLAFTSLRDTSGNVVLEALGAGAAVVCFDHQGVRDIVGEDCGIKIPVESRRRAVLGLREAIIDLHSDRKKLAHLRRGARCRAVDYLWSRQMSATWRVYRQVLGDDLVPRTEGSEKDSTSAANGTTAPRTSPSGSDGSWVVGSKPEALRKRAAE